MSKQDGYSSRTAVDLERKYNFGKTFAEVYNLVSDAQRAAEEASKAVDNLTHDEVFNLLTDFGESQGVYRDDATGDVYINASYIKGGIIKGGVVQVEAASITGELTATQINTQNLKVSNSNFDGKLSASHIDVGELEALGLTAMYLQGRTVDLISAEYDEDGELVDTYTAGGLEITGASSADFKILLQSKGALHLDALAGDIYIEDGSGAHLSLSDEAVTMQGSSAYFEASDNAWVSGDFLPVYRERFDCGNSDYPWLQMHTVALYVDGEGVTSDRNKKHDIVYDLSRFDAVFDGLQPVTYKLNNGTSNRDHIGLVAQDVEELITSCGMTGQDIGVVVRETTENGSVHYYLRYTEFIGLLIDQVQKLKARVAELEEKIA